MGNGGLAISTAHESAGGGSGTVTSVSITGANGIGVSGSPVTTSGTVALSLGVITGATWNGNVVGLAYGGTGADLSSSGGPGQYVKQSTSGGVLASAMIDRNDILEYQHQLVWQARPNSASTVDVQPSTGASGGVAPTAAGTGSSVNDSTGVYISYASAASTNSNAGWSEFTNTLVGTENAPVFYAALMTGSSLATCRLWVGLAASALIASDTPSVHYAAFRYSPAVDGTAFWRCVTDNGSGSPTVTVTTAAIAVSTRYKLRIDATDPASIKFYINDALVATHTTTLPTSSTKLGIEGRLRTLENVAKALALSRVVLNHR